MECDTKPPLIHFNPPLPTAGSTIAELISYLRSTYRKEHFDLVESILLTREANLKKSVKEMSMDATSRKKDCELIESKYCQLVSEKVVIEDELKKRRRENDEIRDDLKRCRFECEELRERVMRLDEEQSLYSGREKRAVERYEKLLDDSRKAESGLRKVIKEYSDRVEELRGEKCRAEAEVVALKKKIGAVELRVLKLEKDIVEVREEEERPGLKRVIGQKGILEKKIGVENCYENLVELLTKGRVSNFSEEVCASPGVGSTCHSLVNHCNGVQEGAADSFGKDCSNGKVVNKRFVPDSRSPSQMMASPIIGSRNYEIIELDDNDDDKPIGKGKAFATNICASEPLAGEKETPTELRSVQTGEEDRRGNSIPFPMPKRKQASSSEIHEGNSGQQKVRRLRKLGHEPQGPANQGLPIPDLGTADVLLSSCHNHSSIRPCEENSGRRHHSSVSYPSSDTFDFRDECLMDSYMDNLVANAQRERDCKLWNYEVDMIRAFEKDRELCMNAVCAIYRQQKLKEKSGNHLLRGSNQGFTQFDALSGIKLAELLIDGDPQGQLRKSVSDLQQHNPEALYECQKLANRYSTQLFQIYKSKRDQFFHS